MQQHIQQDVETEIERFVGLVRRTLDCNAYPRISDGDAFEAHLSHMQREFARIEQVFHDYLLAAWSDEFASVIEATSKRCPPRNKRARADDTCTIPTLPRRIALAAAVLPALAAVLAILTHPGLAAGRLIVGAMAMLVSLLMLAVLRHDRRLAAHEQNLLDMQQVAFESRRMHSSHLRGVLEVSRVLNAETEPQAVFDAIATICKATFSCDRVSLMLLDRDTKELVVRAASGHEDPAQVLGMRRKLGEGMSGWVAERLEPLILGPDVVHPAHRPYPDASALTAAMLVPILVRGELDGVLNVGSRAAGAQYGPEDLRALQVFAESAGTCIRHAERAAWTRRMIAAYQTGMARAPQPEPSAI